MNLFPIDIRPNTILANIKENVEALRSMPGRIQNTLLCTSKTLSIVQIGAGGTGGYVAAEILRFLGSLPYYLQARILYTLVDGDNFEPKNLGRQLCTEDDIGQNKAKVLVDTYGEIFGCKKDNIHAVPTYITSEEQLRHIIRTCGSPDGALRFTLANENGDTDRYINNWHDMVFMSGSGNISLDTTNIFSRGNLTTIIIDCVDRTTPRQIINNVIKDLAGIRDKRRNLNIVKYDDAATTLRKANQYISTIGRGKYLMNGEATAIGPQSSDDFSEVNPTGEPTILNNREIYLISSGNGKYTGQVYWGRAINVDGDYIELPHLYPGIEKGKFIPVHKYTDSLARKGNHLYKELDKDYNVRVSLPDAIESFGKIFRQYQGWYLKGFSEILRYDVQPFYIPWTLLNSEELEEQSEFLNSLTQLLAWEAPRLPFTPDWCIHGACKPDLRYSSINSQRGLLSTFCSVPLPYKKFPLLIDPRIDAEEDALSCAERAVQNVQNIQTNKTAAQLVVNYFMQIVNGLYPYIEVSTPLTTAGVEFNVATNTFKPEPLTVDYLLEYGCENPDEE